MRHLSRAIAIGSLLGARFVLAPPLAVARPADGSLPIGDVLQAPTLAPYSPPAFSPDGRHLAYVVTDPARRREAVESEAIVRSGLAWYGIASDIWVADLTSGEKRNVTGGSGHAWAPSWSPDGSRLAAVMRAGMGDMFAQYGQLAPDGTNYGLAWAESGQGRMGGNPWEYRERYLENSPSLYLDRVRTPLLIIHGSKDDAVPVFLADSVFTGLRRLGKPVAYARYEGETHWEGTWSYPHQLDALEPTIGWFDRYLKAPPPPAQKETASKAGP